MEEEFKRMENNNHPQENGDNNKIPKSQIYVLLIAALITLFAVTTMRDRMEHAQRKEVTYDEFVREVNLGNVDSALIKGSEIIFSYKESTQKNPLVEYYVVRMEGDYGLVDRLT